MKDISYDRLPNGWHRAWFFGANNPQAIALEESGSSAETFVWVRCAEALQVPLSRSNARQVAEALCRVLSDMRMELPRSIAFFAPSFILARLAFVPTEESLTHGAHGNLIMTTKPGEDYVRVGIDTAHSYLTPEQTMRMANLLLNFHQTGKLAGQGEPW